MGPVEVPSWGYPEVIELGELGELGELDDVDELDELIRNDLSPPLALTRRPSPPTPSPVGDRRGGFRLPSPRSEGRRVGDEGFSRPLLDSRTNGLPARTAALGWIGFKQ
jgi:hypothetical protein